MRIVIKEPEGESRELELVAPESRIGRAKGNDIVLNDQAVSSSHAIISVHPDGTLWIEDLNSRNGVSVQGERISGPRRLSGGDLATLGCTTIGIQSPAPSVAEPVDATAFLTIALKAPPVPMIVLDKVAKSYKLGKFEVHALKRVDLKVEEGEFISVCGPSGSGKSTLLNLIGCIDSPTSGKVSILGKDVANFSDSALSKLRNSTIGFIFQSFNLIPVLTAFENIEYPLVILGRPRTERFTKVAAILKEVGLTDFGRHKPDELSGGQRQRVAIARALVTGPKMVLADEPTANLDSKTGIEILDLMQRMNEEHKTTFIFSTHDPKIEKYAKKIYTMTDGVLKIE